MMVSIPKMVQNKEETNHKAKLAMRKRREEYPEKIKAISDKYVNKNREELNRKMREHKKKYKREVNARVRTQRYIIKAKECQECGSTEKLEFHHTDYDKDGGFTVCRKCHGLLHRID